MLDLTKVYKGISLPKWMSDMIEARVEVDATGKNFAIILRDLLVQLPEFQAAIKADREAKEVR